VRAFALEDGTALAHLHNVSGGLLGGDYLAMQVNLASGAKVQLTTTGATRIYRSREGFSATTQCNEVSIAEGALLEYLPDATIPFAGARYLQRTSINLAAGPDCSGGRFLRRVGKRVASFLSTKSSR